MSDKTYNTLMTVGWVLVAIGSTATVIKRLWRN